jgi:hypothetical protein
MMTKRNTFRVKAYSKQVPAGIGYVGYEEIHIQILQRFNGLWWVKVDEEEVPHHAYFSSMFMGYTGGWVSKFAQYIP